MQWETGAQYRISYQSESGRITERTIDIIRTSYSYGGTGYLRAFCHLRNEERTFRTDRVIRAERVFRAERVAIAQAPTFSSASFSRAWVAVRQEPVPAPVVPVWRQEAVASPAREGGGFKSFAVKTVRLALGICILAVILGKLRLPDHDGTGTVTRTVANATVKPLQAITPRPSPPPQPAVEDSTIAGLTLRTHRDDGVESYEVLELGITTMSKVEAIEAIRLPLFVEATGLTDPALIDRYIKADLNASGKLSWDELSAFQKKSYREFRYEANDRALRPDEFLQAGGGDCDDFALYSAGLLRFWGWEPYLGSLAGSRNGVGHAVCLSFEEGSVPGGFTWFDLSSWSSEEGTTLKNGRYVPIDYDQVGSLSDAVEKGWKLRSIYIPEKAWGLRM